MKEKFWCFMDKLFAPPLAVLAMLFLVCVTKQPSRRPRAPRAGGMK